MINNTLNYIIAFYLSDRMSRLYSDYTRKNKFYFLEKHIEFLNKGTDIDLVTFVFNVDDFSVVDEIAKKILTSNIQFKYEVVIRYNTGFSYGAWNEVINKNIKKFDYYFISEDDYIPTIKNFYKPFIDKLSDNAPYVAFMTSEEIKRHASFSIGVFKGDACCKVYEKYNKVFKIIETKEYRDAYTNQIDFFDYFRDFDYTIENIIDEYKLPYMDSSKNSITYYGKKDNPVLFIPIGITI